MRGLIQFGQDFKYAVRSLSHVKGLALTVIVTLALGIGANAAIFSLVRGVLLRPLVNQDENRLIYIRQSAPGLGEDDTAFSVPEIQDLKGGVPPSREFGDFSVIGFTLLGLGEPREIQGGVVSGNYFEVVGLHPVLGRLIGPQDDGPNAAGVVVLTYRFWNTALKKDPPSSARLFASKVASASARRKSSGSLNLPSRTHKTPRSSPTSSPARITCRPPWSPVACIA